MSEFPLYPNAPEMVSIEADELHRLRRKAAAAEARERELRKALQCFLNWHESDPAPDSYSRLQVCVAYARELLVADQQAIAPTWTDTHTVDYGDIDEYSDGARA